MPHRAGNWLFYRKKEELPGSAAKRRGGARTGAAPKQRILRFSRAGDPKGEGDKPRDGVCLGSRLIPRFHDRGDLLGTVASEAQGTAEARAGCALGLARTGHDAHLARTADDPGEEQAWHNVARHIDGLAADVLLQAAAGAADGDAGLPSVVGGVVQGNQIARAGHEVVATEVNRTGDPALVRQLKGLGAVLNILQKDPAVFLKGATEGLDEAEIRRLIDERAAAKKARNFARADEIRDELLAKGITLLDKAEGTVWRRA